MKRSARDAVDDLTKMIAQLRQDLMASKRCSGGAARQTQPPSQRWDVASGLCMARRPKQSCCPVDAVVFGLSSRYGRRRGGRCGRTGKVERGVEDRVQTTTSANET